MRFYRGDAARCVRIPPSKNEIKRSLAFDVQAHEVSLLALRRGKNSVPCASSTGLTRFRADHAFFNADDLVLEGRTCHGGIRLGQLRLIDLLHICKSRGKEDEAQNRDDRHETWQEVFFYPHFHLPCPHRTLLQDGVS